METRTQPKNEKIKPDFIKTLEQKLIISNKSYQCFLSSCWTFLCALNSTEKKALGRQLKVRKYSNIGNLNEAILAQLNISYLRDWN